MNLSSFSLECPPSPVLKLSIERLIEVPTGNYSKSTLFHFTLSCFTFISFPLTALYLTPAFQHVLTGLPQFRHHRHHKPCSLLAVSSIILGQPRFNLFDFTLEKAPLYNIYCLGSSLTHLPLLLLSPICLSYTHPAAQISSRWQESKEQSKQRSQSLSQTLTIPFRPVTLSHDPVEGLHA